MGAAALLCVVSLLEAAAGSYVMTDSNIYAARDAWLSDSAAAEAAYGHISTWDTSGVTDMLFLFCGHYSGSQCNPAAASFNEDIGAWDTSGVTRMYGMFQFASAFDQNLSNWRVDKVTSMYRMFYKASAFDQDLGWCVDDDVDLGGAFGVVPDYTPCASTSCGVIQAEDQRECDVPRTGNVMVNWKIKQAVAAWLSDASAAEATYGHISMWATGGVTDMSNLFAWKSSFNEDIGAWDTSGVTTMHTMFYHAYAFNQDIGGWAVHSVTNMNLMFTGASSFNQDIGGWAVDSVKWMDAIFQNAANFDQDLGWCVDGGVNLFGAFDYTQCASTSCGVVRGTFDANGEVVCLPAKKEEKEESPVAVIVGTIAAVVLLLAVGGFWFYRRRKASMVDKADELSGASSPPKSNPEPTELSPPEEATSPKEATGPESLEARAAAKAKAAETVERAGFARKLSSFLFGEQEEEPTALAVAEAEEAPSAEQPPPPTPAEPTAPKAEGMYNRIATWYNEPKNAALRARWGAYPEPEEFQTWSGFVAVTNAFLDRETG